jgi:hypothetical protein
MSLHEGDQVSVNLAPFIGVARRSTETVLCRVLTVGNDWIEVRPEEPLRDISLRVATQWIEPADSSPRGRSPARDLAGANA